MIRRRPSLGAADAPWFAWRMLAWSLVGPGKPVRRAQAATGSATAMSRDTSFYYAFLVLPPAKRNAIIAVWDFCRAVDDAVDEVAPEDEWAGG